jgi:hypothetical protein
MRLCRKNVCLLHIALVSAEGRHYDADMLLKRAMQVCLDKIQLFKIMSGFKLLKGFHLITIRLSANPRVAPLVVDDLEASRALASMRFLDMDEGVTQSEFL